MPLHCRENWDNMSQQDGWSAFVLNPPFIEGSVRADVEALFW
jgi:hypothetical protein